MLEHIGAHILFDTSVDPVDMPCGLCLRPSAVCQYSLLKGKGSKGNPRVDMERSAACPRLVKFQWGKAAVSDKNSPCSNVPLFCPLCPKVVWRYNLRHHLSTSHSPDMVVRYADTCEIPNDEINAMRHIWKNRQNVPTKRKKRTGAPALVISEAHTTIDNLPRYVNIDLVHRSCCSPPMICVGFVRRDDSGDCPRGESGSDDSRGEDSGTEQGDSEGEGGATMMDNSTPSPERPEDHVTMWGFENTVYSPEPYDLSPGRGREVQEGDVDGHCGPLSELAGGGRKGGAGEGHPAHQTPIDNSNDDVIAVTAPEGPSTSGNIEPNELGRGKRVPKRKDRGHLNICICGELVDVKDITRAVVRCAQPGCETQHVCISFYKFLQVNLTPTYSSLQFHRACTEAPKNDRLWKCQSCAPTAAKAAKRGKRS